MKKVIFILFLLCVHLTSYSQYYDLIITTKGEAIACHIKTTKGDAINFEFMNEKEWIHSSLSKDKIATYKWKVINKSSVVFEKGSSIISRESERGKEFARFALEGDSVSFQPDIEPMQFEQIEDVMESIYDSPRNTIYTDFNIYFKPMYQAVLFSINYDRVIPIHSSVGISLRGGFGTISRSGALGIAEVSILAGGPVHYAEGGGGIFAGGFVTEGYFKLGYRWLPGKGFTTRLALLLNSGDIGVGLSFGLAF